MAVGQPLCQYAWIMFQIREFEGEFFCCAPRSIAFQCRNDFIRRGNEAAFFAPIALAVGQPLGLEAAGAEQEREAQGDDEYSDPARVDNTIRSNRLNGFGWRGGFHCSVSCSCKFAIGAKHIDLIVNGPRPPSIHAALRIDCARRRARYHPAEQQHGLTTSTPFRSQVDVRGACHKTIICAPHTDHQSCGGHTTANIRRKALRLSYELSNLTLAADWVRHSRMDSSLKSALRRSSGNSTR